MYSAAINKKMTFLIIVLLVPMIALLYVGQSMVSSQIKRYENGISSIKHIENIWQITEQINRLDVTTPETNTSDDLRQFLRTSKIDPKKQEKMISYWDTLNDESVSTKKRLLNAQRLIFNFSRTTELIGVISEMDAEHALNMTDRIPELSVKLETFARLGETIHNKQELTNTDLMAFLVNAGQFKSVADYVSRSTRSELQIESKTLANELSALASEIRKKNGSFQGAAVKVVRPMLVNKSILKTSLDKFLEHEKIFDTAISGYWRKSDQVFNAWMFAKLESLNSLYQTVIAGLGMFMFLLIVSIWALRKSILGQARQLETTIEQTEEQNAILKEREQELIEQRTAAESAERAKTDFLANMSHEIRTPMNGVMGMAEMLAVTELDSKQQMFTDVIIKSGASLLTIINDILDFSKIDAKQMELTTAPFNLTEAIEDVAALVSSKVAEKDLELNVRIDPSLPEMYVGDAGRIRQIVTNLLGNAVKFTEEGHIYVNVSRTDAAKDDDNNIVLHFEIEDTGIGIPHEKCSQIFQKFSQVDTSATRKHDGTGLGLSISSSLVELMEGEIGVDSELGQGSTFWFKVELPIHTESIQPRAIPRDISGSRILVIDDNKVNRAILKEQMTSWQFDSAAASSGAEGLEVMNALYHNNLDLDLVILDYHMPDMNGLMVLENIRSNPNLKDTPVIMLTSVDSPQINKDFARLGISGNLTKPTRSSVLLEKIIDVISSKNVNFDDVKSAIASIRDMDTDKPVEPKPVTIEPGPQLDVLVAEDNSVNQVVFTQTLEQVGVNFRIVENGKEALNEYKRNRPRLVLMDISMPVMNGKDATKAIRQYEENANLPPVPIIAITAHALNGDRESCLEAGMDDYMTKPVSPSMLINKVEEWLAASSKNDRLVG